jgi:hypothetical protein
MSITILGGSGPDPKLLITDHDPDPLVGNQ